MCVCVCVCVSVCGLVTFRNAIIALLEPGTTGIQKHVISFVHSKNVYKNADIFKAIKRYL